MISLSFKNKTGGAAGGHPNQKPRLADSGVGAFLQAVSPWPPIRPADPAGCFRRPVRRPDRFRHLRRKGRVLVPCPGSLKAPQSRLANFASYFCSGDSCRRRRSTGPGSAGTRKCWLRSKFLPPRPPTKAIEEILLRSPSTPGRALLNRAGRHHSDRRKPCWSVRCDAPRSTACASTAGFHHGSKRNT